MCEFNVYAWLGWQCIGRKLHGRFEIHKSVFSRLSVGCLLLICGRDNRIVLVYKFLFPLPMLFPAHLHTHQNKLPLNSSAGQALSEILLFPSVKCAQYHILEIISPRILLLLKHIQKHTLHACTHAYVLYLSLC